MSSLGGQFQPRVASEELVPTGNTQILSTKNPRQKRWGSEPSCVCVCVHVCACFKGRVLSVLGPRY